MRSGCLNFPSSSNFAIGDVLFTFYVMSMGALLAALIAILAILGVVIALILLTLATRSQPESGQAIRPLWIGRLAVRYFNHPPQVWSAP